MKYYIITYGCQMNHSDSERIAAFLESIGYHPSKNEKEADLIVINTCSVRQSAVDRVYGKIKNFSSNKNNKLRPKIILTGCILPSDKKKLKNKADFVLNIKNLPKWKNYLLPKPISNNKDITGCKYLEIKPKHQNNYSVYIPISTGCNNACSYCAVPYTRGSLACRDYKQILKEVKYAVNKLGTKEIWLLGQNVNDYNFIIKEKGLKFKKEKKLNKKTENRVINFADLLKMINDIPGNFWIRFTSPHPKNFSDELIKTMAKCKKITPYLNLPVQSGDSEILKKMNRLYSIENYKKLVKKIRKAFNKYRKGVEKNITLSTDIIVGFPGETKKQFENTVKLFKEIKFDMAYIAEYSPRAGTAAFKLKDNVSKKEKERRRKILTEILKKTALEKNKKYIGKTIEVLPEKIKNGFLIGKSKTYKTVKFKGNQNLIGIFVKVKITDALTWGLKGELYY